MTRHSWAPSDECSLSSGAWEALRVQLLKAPWEGQAPGSHVTGTQNVREAHAESLKDGQWCVSQSPPAACAGPDFL